MRRRLLLSLVFLAGAACGIAAPVLPPPPPPPPAEPPPQPPEPPAPPTPPPPAPAALAELLARLTPGLTVAEVERAIGSAPVPVPQAPAAPWTVRWDVAFPDGRFLVFAVFNPDGTLVRANAAPIVDPK